MSELQFQVLIDPELPRVIEGVVRFDSGYDSDDIDCYSSVTEFQTHLALGKAFPLVMGLREIRTIPAIVAVSLFLNRHLVLAPQTITLVAAADMVGRYGCAGMANIDPDLARFFALLIAYLPEGLTKAEQQGRLQTAVGWIVDYVHSWGSSYPSLPAWQDKPRILDKGTNGFVVAECGYWSPEDLRATWIDLYRDGYLRGVLFGMTRNERRTVCATRKSVYVSLDLAKAAEILNEAERAMGEPPEWVVQGEWLHSPKSGTLMVPSTIIKVLTHVD